MNILVTGSTGTIGSLVVRGLAAQGASVRALTRDPAKASFPEGVIAVKGDMTDVPSMRAALQDVDTLFLLNAVVADEVTQAIGTLSLAREAGIQRVVYLSVLNSDAYTDVPHFTGKYTVERMIEQFDLPVTVLRPSYFMQNDAALKDGLLQGRYGMPIGNVGVAMVDVRDIAEIAVAALLRRARSATPLPREVIEITGPDVLTGDALATIWSGVLGKPVTPAGNDLDAWETAMAGFMPSWSAYDLRLMLARFHVDGMLGKSNAVELLTGLLGHPPRRYRDLAGELAKAWEAA
ncbi:NmrA family transcriptional regulator [Rhodanobacter sp. Root561]|uniref:NmrA/HSCARG family protein n=1 Tax=Rhodanobacter sp. Root561 TaxID=1736560 RepID=UPI00070038AC|nr:NmrA/HSCARG family protein [Rhodanobacter sp. Root561]KQZ79357.1 NmrA family transcriptional regulator [Rhodanobacter sp. Root561]